ncbi:MAG TPA: hypothetical protein PKD00_10750, partial [Burkholderiales bacterium]|nr:hypothetical protein [Burkholderiales bacterium]
MIKKIFVIFIILTTYESVASNSSVFSLGGTYDSISLHPTFAKSCLNAAENEANLEILNPHASLNFTQEQSIQSVQRALGIEYTSRISYGAFSMNTGYNYAQSSQNDDYTLNLNYIYQYNGKAVFKDNTLGNGKTALTPDAVAVFNSPNEFRHLCGNKFIAQLDAGASLLMRVTLKFNSQVEKEYYEESFQHVNGLLNILESIKSNTNHVYFNLSAAGLQVGGNPQLLNDIFIKNNGSINRDGYAVLECGTDNNTNSACINLVTQIIDYAKTLSGQLNKPADFYLANPTTSDWGEL